MPCKDRRQKLIEKNSCAKDILLGCFRGVWWVEMSVLVCRTGTFGNYKEINWNLKIVGYHTMYSCAQIQTYCPIIWLFTLLFVCTSMYIDTSNIYKNIHIYTYVTSIAGHNVNALTWYNVKCAFSRHAFYFIPGFGLHLCKLGHEENVVMNYQATLNYHQTSFTSKVTKWRKQYLAVMTIAITLSINLGMLMIPLVWFNKSLIWSSLKSGFQLLFRNKSYLLRWSNHWNSLFPYILETVQLIFKFPCPVVILTNTLIFLRKAWSVPCSSSCQDFLVK